MKKNYELPEWEIVLFDEEDVVRTSPVDSQKESEDVWGDDFENWD